MTVSTKRIIAGALTFSLFLLPNLAIGAPRKMAVLVGTLEVTVDNQLDHSEYWHDVVLVFDLLVENGFAADDIYVLYGNGSDFNSTTNQITDFPATKAVIEEVIACLRDGGCDTTSHPPKLGCEDFLLLAWIGHGYNGADAVNARCDPSSTGATMYLDTMNGGSVCDYELASWLDEQKMDFRRRALLFATCSSGGVVDGLSGANTVVLASCPEEGSDYSCEFSELGGDPVEHREWVFLMNTALRQTLVTATAFDPESDICEQSLGGLDDQVDGSANNLVSLEEAFDRAVTNGLWSTWATTPVIDNRDKAKCTHLELPEPSRDVEIFSMDHLNDNSIVQSEPPTVPWWNGPDLWVRDSFGCYDENHVEPVFGETNFLCARVHNIGCTNLDNVEVVFSWVESTGWADPGSWNDIGTAFIDIGTDSSIKTAPVAWSDTPLPGSYCLHAVANAVGDPSSNPRAYLDNNTTQINVSVLGVVPGTWSWWLFNIENWSDEGMENIDLQFDLSQLPQGTEVVVELPGILGNEAIVPPSATLSEENGWAVISFAPSVSMVEVKGVNVNLHEPSRRAVLKMKVPSSVTSGVAAMRMTESVEGNLKGGIVFEGRITGLKEAAWRAFRTQAQLMKRFASAVDDRVAAAAFEKLAGETVTSDRRDLIAAFEDVREAIEALPGQETSELLSRSVYGARYETSAEKFNAAVSIDATPEESLRMLLQSARELSLYAWLVLTNSN